MAKSNVLSSGQSSNVSPTDGEQPVSKVIFQSGDKANAPLANSLTGTNFNVVPLPTGEASNARGFTLKPKLPPMDQGRKKQTFGGGTDFSGY